MRDAAGQPPHGLHLLRLPEMVLALPEGLLRLLPLVQRRHDGGVVRLLAPEGLFGHALRPALEHAGDERQDRRHQRQGHQSRDEIRVLVFVAREEEPDVNDDQGRAEQPGLETREGRVHDGRQVQRRGVDRRYRRELEELGQPDGEEGDQRSPKIPEQRPQRRELIGTDGCEDPLGASLGPGRAGADFGKLARTFKK